MSTIGGNGKTQVTGQNPSKHSRADPFNALTRVSGGSSTRSISWPAAGMSMQCEDDERTGSRSVPGRKRGTRCDKIRFQAAPEPEKWLALDETQRIELV